MALQVPTDLPVKLIEMRAANRFSTKRTREIWCLHCWTCFLPAHRIRIHFLRLQCRRTKRSMRVLWSVSWNFQINLNRLNSKLTSPTCVNEMIDLFVDWKIGSVFQFFFLKIKFQLIHCETPAICYDELLWIIRRLIFSLKKTQPSRIQVKWVSSSNRCRPVRNQVNYIHLQLATFATGQNFSWRISFKIKQNINI